VRLQDRSGVHPERIAEMAAKTGTRAKPEKSANKKDDQLELRKVVRALRDFVKKTVPGTQETINSWGIPTFEAPKPFCFYMVAKNHVTLGFHYGTSVKDPQGLLEGTGKNIRHVKLHKMEDLEQKGLRNLVLAAARLGGKPPMRGMGGK
jgi:hypothetical protein